MKNTCLWLLTIIMVFSLPLSADDGWRIEAESFEPYAPPTIANGMIGVTPDMTALRTKLTILNGVMDIWGEDQVQSITPAPDLLQLELMFDGAVLTDTSQITDWRQTLDMRNAVLVTKFVFNNSIKVRHQLRALRHMPYSLLATLDIKALKNGKLTVRHKIQAPSAHGNILSDYKDYKWRHTSLPLSSMVVETPGAAARYAGAVGYRAITDDGAQIPAVYDENAGAVTFSANTSVDNTVHLTLFGTLISDTHVQDPLSEAKRLTIYAALETAPKLITQHQNAWADLWRGDIIIEGAPEAQRTVRSALFNLYSTVRSGTAYAPAPMGLSSLEYYGHVFWDSELWMLPSLMVLQPDLAKSALEYRFSHLEAARQNALVHGYRGAMFPWEADDQGQESTPPWALSGPFEHHITAVVGLAFWNMYRITGDETWLRERAYPVLAEVADFWVSRVSQNDAGGYDILNVVGADEYAENVDNNAFTNGAAIAVLRAAKAAAETLGIAAKPVWSEVANGIVIEKMSDGVTAEYRGYDGRMVKQADVNLLAYPLDIVSTPSAIARDLAYYAPRFDEEHGPAMTNAILAVLAARLKQPEAAWAYFQKAYKPKQRPPFGVLAEATSLNNPYFVTRAGGLTQAALFGFGGLHITDHGLKHENVPLPKHWKSLTIKGAGPEKKTYTTAGQESK